MRNGIRQHCTFVAADAKPGQRQRAAKNKTLTVVQGLKVINQSKDVGVANRDSTEHCNLIANHMLLALHQLLVDHLDSISLASLNLISYSHATQHNTSSRH